ncbi:GL10542 [Drosophila persimilis]|uniref:GL10542 n=1 Tax=Drosophila persimilis TaxID=7234 RepID=B4GBC8_DROPE|nr:GL10542 [Drosophila persimilis]
MPDITIDECHDDYLLACANASLTFSDAFDLCEQTANETKSELSIDEENDLDYFKCISDNGSRNIDILSEITYNSTSALTRLREDYDDVYRTYLLCTLDAQKNYIENLREAYTELSQCRVDAGDYLY